ncbi:HAMP domain-containing sensor histidine kinase [Alteromonas sp. ASW11-130]|uniref:HAMP domain-containing sensor histidine kinase n=1 Tax=Alteromonas sp. ASW11-130 TaxID=3015775 RepID=UPI0022422F04|nr:HAMP domain-containing sensor histidine kinase [Alteromonas sp. ASW11-130]MCW8091784.1 HAMP domain-containing histidine kinase [Alteromonas sp. ASW11-130]
MTALSVAAVIFILYFWTLANDEVFVKEAYAALENEQFTFGSIYRFGGQDALEQAVSIKVNVMKNRTLIGLFDKNLQPLAGNLSKWPEVKQQRSIFQVSKRLNQLISENYAEKFNPRSKHFLVTIRKFNKDRILFLARDVQHLYSAQWMGSYFSWVFIGFLLAIVVLSYFVAWYVVNRINRMALTADNIMKTGNLKRRLHVDSHWDDLSRLAIVFNRMLTKIDESFTNIKSVTDNIAHDLRTPLSRLRTTLEKIPEPDLRKKSLQETDSLLAMFNGLLRIGDIETQHQRRAFKRVQLDVIVNDVLSLYQPIAEQKKMNIEVDVDPVVIIGDRDLIFQAIANIIDNCIKYAGANSTISVVVKEYKRCVGISVNDSGPGVSSDQFVHLERRFYRAEESRTSSGNGLGLSLVRAVAKLHDGNLWFIDNPKMQKTGLGVTITLPKISTKNH